MELRPIRTKREYRTALKEVEALWDAPQGTPEADRLEVLTLLIEAYERKHFPIETPDSIDFLEHVMEARGWRAGILNATSARAHGWLRC